MEWRSPCERVQERLFVTPTNGQGTPIQCLTDSFGYHATILLLSFFRYIDALRVRHSRNAMSRRRRVDRFRSLHWFDMCTNLILPTGVPCRRLFGTFSSPEKVHLFFLLKENTCYYSKNKSWWQRTHSVSAQFASFPKEEHSVSEYRR